MDGLGWSQGNAALPGDKIILVQSHGLGRRAAAGNFDDEVEDLLTNLLDGLLSGNDRTRVEVDDVRHLLRQPGVRGKFDHL